MVGIYFVGGASASGKSVATRKMADEAGWPRFELDGLYNALQQDCDEETRQRVMKTACREFISQLLDGDAPMIIEGGWMWPDVAAALRSKYPERFCPVYCGYPNASAAERLEAIRAHPSPKKHWLACKDDAIALPLIDQQISGSEEYRKAATRVGLPFFDFTDVSKGSAELLTHFRDWLQKR